jgi:uncharacterized protein (TIGR03118 family)
MAMNGRSSGFPARPWPARAALLAAAGVLAALAACGGGGGSSNPPPTLNLAVQPASIVQGQSATLSWSASDGTTCSASGAWSGSQASSGSQAVTPAAAGSQSYTLSCSGGSYDGSATQTATLTVSAASAFSSTALVANAAGAGAQTVDTHLVNGWGIAFGGSTPVWVANRGTDTSTLYNGNGKAQPVASPRVVSLDAGFGATGIVFNGSSDFVVSAAGKSAAASFIFSGEGGRIAGWAASVDGAKAITTYTDAGGAVYKGLAIASNGSANFLYAADFRNGKVDVFDAAYQKQTAGATQFAFSDPQLPAGYAPFGIQALRTGAGGAAQIYVAYARKAGPNDRDETVGAGLGLVNVFDANGGFVRRLVSPGGRLDAPWGLALAPADFGTLSNAVLVGNFGDGRINGFDAATGAYVGTVADSAGRPFAAAAGLWGIAFGNGAANQPRNTLFYAAGPDGETAGLYGRIDLGATPPALNVPPAVTLALPAGNLSGTVALTATVSSPLAISKVEFFVNGASVGSATSSPYTVQWDSTQAANGSVSIVATATDSDGNAGSSAAATATVANGTAPPPPPPAPTLAQLQAEIFTPRCTGCHNGSGGGLPGVMDLSSGSSFGALVGVASIEAAPLLRVKPGDAANSYLVQKLEGAAGIAGSRMPLGGPFLDAATIDKVKAWINAGALNN